MDLLLGNILVDDEFSNKDANPILNDILTARDDYSDYFVSLPQAGSIVEEIAETDAKIAALERQLKDKLVDAKASILEDLCEGDVVPHLDQISQEISQLWELDASLVQRTEVDEEKAADVEGILGELDEEYKDTKQAVKEDAFQEALKMLRDRQKSKTEFNFALVLQKLEKMTDLMELPTLVNMCIRTGHYQEALICHSYVQNLRLKFPTIELVEHISALVQHDVSKTMLQGLVKLLSSNLTINSIKKVVSYLSSIEPLQDNPLSLQQLFLTMRYRFVTSEIDSYVVDDATYAVREMLVKRKVECVREHVYSILSVFNSVFQAETVPLHIPLYGEQKEDAKEVPTSLYLLQFVKECTSYLIAELLKCKIETLSESVCLQLVYCSFRLGDINTNFNHLFINSLLEAQLFSRDMLEAAIQKRQNFTEIY